jgi:hypothetical protein
MEQALASLKNKLTGHQHPLSRLLGDSAWHAIPKPNEKDPSYVTYHLTWFSKTARVNITFSTTEKTATIDEIDIIKLPEHESTTDGVESIRSVLKEILFGGS